MITHFKIYGERNTGTNYVQRLFQTNFELEYWRSGVLGWKHGFAPADRIKKGNYDHVLFLIVCKNPYSWLLSMHKNPHHAMHLQRLTFENFCNSEWQSFYDGPGRKKIKDEHFSNIFELRRMKAVSHAQVLQCTSHAIVLNYEELLNSAEEVVENIANRFDLPKSNSFFSEINKYYTGQHKKYGEVFNRQRYYLGEEWKNKFSQQQLSIVNDHLDFEIENKLGYYKYD
jgi:hypothetical protein